MTFHDRGSGPAAHSRATAAAGDLIITVYRYAMAGFSLGQTDCWEVGWQALSCAVPPGDAGPLFGEFYGFVRALLTVTKNELSWRPVRCRGLCYEEALALDMIAAAQRSDTVGLLTAAATLLGVDELGDALQATQSLATALARRGLLIRAARQEEPCGFDLCPQRRLH